MDIAPREIEIGRLDLVEMTAEGNSVFEVQCGKGTYVRSLARDLGRDLGCFGHIAELRRTEVDPFTAADLVSVDQLETARFGGSDAKAGADASVPPAAAAEDFKAIDALLVETAAALECLPHVAISDEAAARIRLGNAIIIRGRDAPVEAEEACALARGKLVAIGAIEAGMFRPKRVFAG